MVSNFSFGIVAILEFYGILVLHVLARQLDFLSLYPIIFWLVKTHFQGKALEDPMVDKRFPLQGFPLIFDGSGGAKKSKLLTMF